MACESVYVSAVLVLGWFGNMGLRGVNVALLDSTSQEQVTSNAQNAPNSSQQPFCQAPSMRMIASANQASSQHLILTALWSVYHVVLWRREMALPIAPMLA